VSGASLNRVNPNVQAPVAGDDNANAVQVIVVANGCSDATVQEANTMIPAFVKAGSLIYWI
jgi:hypothetical protein